MERRLLACTARQLIVVANRQGCDVVSGKLPKTAGWPPLHRQTRRALQLLLICQCGLRRGQPRDRYSERATTHVVQA